MKYAKPTIDWSDEQLEGLNIDRYKLKKLLRRIELSVKDASDMGLEFYANSGELFLIHPDYPIFNGNTAPNQENLIASVFGPFDGGGW